MAKTDPDHISKFHDYGIYIPKRMIYMSSVDVSTEHGESGVDSAMAEYMVKNLAILEGMNSEDITILMNNVGGDEYHGFAIYDAIQACKSQVTIKVYGHAMSMGSIILQAADHRIMAPTSRQMIHYGTAPGSGSEQHSKTAKKWQEESDKLDLWMENMYMAKIREKHPDFNLGKLRRMLDHDTFMTAKESIDFGLADSILDNEAENE
jgi:ATP-dependent Clp protease protease subunit